MNNMKSTELNLVNNPAPRIPICLCLDTSGSMGGALGVCEDNCKKEFIDGKMRDIVSGSISKINELQKAIEQFYDAICEDDIARYSVELCIVTFDDNAKCVLDFSNVEKQTDILQLTAKGDTAMGEGVNLALDLWEKRKKEYMENGVDYYQPRLVLMTDGEINGDPNELSKAIERTCKMVSDKKLTIFPVGIGDDVDMSVLNRFSPNIEAFRLQEHKHQEFFDCLYKSVHTVFKSCPGEDIEFDIEDLKKWIEL